MRIVRADIVTVRHAVEGARSASGRWAQRGGALVRVVTPDGLVAEGEAAPLPGYCRERLEDATAALDAIDWSALPEPDRVEGAAPLLERLRAAPLTPSPSARFAVETALLDVLAQRTKRPLWTLLPLRHGARPVPLSVLVGGADDPGAVDVARRAIEQGARTVKLKLRGPVLGAQLDVARAVRDAIGNATLRFDANRTFAPETAARELRPLADLEPEFVEEPVFEGALSTVGELPVPVALDESLQDPSAWDRLEPHLERLRCTAVVLKPTALGGFSTCLELAERAAARGLYVTVSHTFDGPVALAASCHLALAVASRDCASGLTAHGGLDAWPAATIAGLGVFMFEATDVSGLGVEWRAELP